MCYNTLMKLKDALLKIKELQANLSVLQAEAHALKIENEIQKGLIFKQQKKLNDLLGQKELVRQKLVIEQIKPFIRKTEKIDEIIINETESVIKDTKKRGRKLGGKNFSKVDLESSVIDTIYEDPDHLECSTCSESLVLTGQKARYVVEVIPSTIKVTKIIKRSYKCPKDGAFYYPLSQSVFPGTLLTPSFAAYLAYHKYELGIPFHHLERHLTNVLNIPISKQLMAHWMALLSAKLQPVFERMKLDLLNNASKVIHADETTLVVSKKPAFDANRKKSYVYLYASSFYDHQIHIYDFHESRAIHQTAAWLKDYQGYVVCDDYAGYNKLKKDNPHIMLQRCWAHARRKFTDILKSIPQDQVKNTTAFKIVELIGQLFKFEALYKENDVPISEILNRRSIDQLPIINALKLYIFDTPLSPNSLIESAIKYVRGIWGDLLEYFNHPYLEISNNIAERAIKPFVINRKVFMTAGSYAGARYTTTIFSIIRTALINRLDIQKYLIYLLDNLGKVDLVDLLPYSDTLPKAIFSKL